MHIVLYQPEIPPNTGNIIRLAANTGCTLHLIHPLGFKLEDKQLQRAGLDYHEFASLKEYKNYEDFSNKNTGACIYACTTKATEYYSSKIYQKEDMFLFGPESRGLPLPIINSYIPIKIPMQPNSRSLNLSNAVSIIIYEAWRQTAFQ
jgi:tRNA (cytidine/uridine-2'-O-)-methyltransferase